MKLVHDLAQQVSITLYAAQLSGDLQQSRERIVTAREEERRRIRRDLHDGLGPTLAALQLQLASLQRHLRHNPDQAETIAQELRADLATATADIRRLVYDLRPPLLDELGLVGAWQQLQTLLPETVLVVEMPAFLPPLSAATEVALYRIANEAILNVAKHAYATQCYLTLALNDTQLNLTISDNGVGLPPDHNIGVGLHAMRERALELGGSCHISTVAPQGTEVRVTFPRS
jgi:signal transduction histidine kinase